MEVMGVMSRSAEKAIYGNVAILRMHCPHCHQHSFVLDGYYTCCHNEVGTVPTTAKPVRVSDGADKHKPPPYDVRQRILAAQDNRCFYCGLPFGEFVWNGKRHKYVKLHVRYDHFVPWKYSHDSGAHNIVAACQICNSIKSAAYFETEDRARAYVTRRRTDKGYTDILIGDAVEE